MAEYIPVAAAGIKITKDAVKEFGKAFRDLKEFGENGARELQDGIASLSKFMGVINPIITPIRLLTTQITSGTLKDSMEFSAELIELIQQDSTQTAIKGIIGGINLAFDGITAVTSALNDFNDAIERTPQKLKETAESIVDVFVSEFEDAKEEAKNILSGLVDISKTWIDKLGDMWDSARGM